jgi:hypothetical protein
MYATASSQLTRWLSERGLAAWLSTRPLVVTRSDNHAKNLIATPFRTSELMLARRW